MLPRSGITKHFVLWPIGSHLWPWLSLGQKHCQGPGCFQPLLWERSSLSFPRRNLLDSLTLLRDFPHDPLSRLQSKPLDSHALPPDWREPWQLPPLGASGLMLVRQSYVERRGHSADGGGGESRPPFNIFTCQPNWGSLKTEGSRTRPWGR